MAWENRPNPQGYAKNWPHIRRGVLDRARYVCVLNWDKCEGNATEVDHIDGDVENNNLSNLRALCSNCHKQVTQQNQRDSRNLMDPRPAPKHAGQIVEKLPPKIDQIIDDFPSENPEEWIVTYGPVFDKDPKTGLYIMPERTLGPYVIQWGLENLQIKGAPFKLTPEQTRIICWMYALTESGDWLYDKTLHIAPKGWGKDPFGSFLLACELAGPVRLKEFDKKTGIPIPMRQVGAWCQIGALSLSQNENTMIYLREIFTPKAMEKYQIEIQAETIYAFGRKSRIESVASGADSKEGQFPTYFHGSELQHWKAQHDKYYDVITRNLAKVNRSHAYLTTNAFDPNDNSHAQRLMESWQDVQAGLFEESGLLLVMKGATHKAPYDTPEQRRYVLKQVYGSAVEYTNIEQLSKVFADNKVKPEQPLRFYYNTIGIPSSAFISILDWDKCKHPKYDPIKGIPKGVRIILAGDMSKNQDSTALIGCVVEPNSPLYGMFFAAGVWEKPRHIKGEAAESWRVPREDVNAVVEELFLHYRVQAFWVDPSHRMDETGGSYWKPLILEWERKFGHKIPATMWAKGTEHAILWDMASHANQKTFTDNLSSFETEVKDHTIKHDGDTDLRRHFSNATRYKSKRFGSTIAKPSPKSPQKIDMAVTTIICYSIFSKMTTNKKTVTTQMKGHYNVPERRL